MTKAQSTSIALVTGLLACGGTSVIDGGAGGNAASSTTTTVASSSSSNSSSGGPGGATSSSGSGQGGSALNCGELDKAYAAEIKMALVCDPFIDIPQCTEIVASDLICQCDVYANPANQESINKLKGYQKAYEDLGCMPNVACDCAPAGSGSCQSEGNAGVCVTSG